MFLVGDGLLSCLYSYCGLEEGGLCMHFCVVQFYEHDCVHLYVLVE